MKEKKGALEVTLDFLVGDGDLKVLDKKTFQQLEDIDKLPQEDKQNIFHSLDNLIKAAKFRTL